MSMQFPSLNIIPALGLVLQHLRAIGFFRLLPKLRDVGAAASRLLRKGRQKPVAVAPSFFFIAQC
jgi:hypothetical protein